jgi:hypothetical protein
MVVICILLVLKKELGTLLMTYQQVILPIQAQLLGVNK